MSYPNFKNKHLEKSLFLAEEYLNYRKVGVKFPKKWIITFQRGVERYIKRKFKLKKIKEHPFQDNIYFKDGIGIVKMSGIGSPHAVTLAEELIGLGAREMIIVGTAGGLDGRGVFLCEKAIRDEGTSSHYIPHEKYSYPDVSLSKKLEKEMNKSGLTFSKGTTWTIDAPYRETKREVEHYKREGVKTVEMEASALFSLAKVRKVKIAAVFTVSDLVVKEGWEPKFDSKSIKRQLNKTVDVALECLKNA